jgi:hypothetical protein
MLLPQWQPYRQLRHIRPASTLMLAVFLLGVMALTACAQTRHVTREGNVDKSGFLGTALYSKLAPGKEDNLDLAFHWRDTTADYHRYTKVLVDPVLLYRQPQHVGGGNSNENAQELINYLHAKLVEALAQYMTIVDKPDPEAVRFQVALTDYEATWVALDIVSTLHPVVRVVAEAKGLAVEKPSFVGAVEAELKMSDSMTGKVLAAGIDRRVGGKTLSKGVSQWSDVHNAMDFWALQVAYRLCKTTGQPGCAKPTYGTLGTLKTEVEK